jgi:hypothetical protein
MSRAPMARAPMARFVPRVANPFSPSYVRFNGVRSPGFVSSRQATIRITRDRFGRLHRVRIITPIFFGAGYPGYYPYGYEPYDDYGYYDTADDTAQQPAPWQSGPTPGESAVAAPEAPVPDIGQFMLVRKNGQVVLANAFTISGDRVTYITPEGTRHSLLVADLDKENTRQRNDANGTSLALPE